MNPGDKLGNYEIVERVGSGAMGDVYRAMQLSMNRTVALKILPERLAGSESFVTRFIREARSAGKCNHGNLIQVYDVGQAEGKYYFSMEFVGGPTLQDVLKTGGPLPEADAIQHMQRIAEALNEAHSREIVHRDVKPSNILLTDRGEPKLADLGLAKPLNNESEETNAGKPLGTPYYMSPEQVRGETVDVRTDLYALGATFYHLLSGQTLFTGPNPGAVMAMHITAKPKRLREVRPDISRGIDAIVMKLVEKKPADRYQDAQSLIDDLGALLQGKKPKHARLFIETGKYRTVGTRGTKATMNAVAAKAAPPPGRSVGFYAAAGAIPVALIMIVVFILTRGKADSRKQDVPAMTVEAPPTVAVAVVEAESAAEEAGQEGAQASRILMEAREYYEKNPSEFDEAIRQFTAVTVADPEGEHGAEAKKKIDEISAARAGELKDLLGAIEAAADRKMAVQDYDGALQACSDVPLDKIATVSREVRGRVEAIRQAGMAAIESVLNEARSHISNDRPDGALSSLKKLERIRYKEGTDLAEPKVADLKDRIEKLRTDLAAKATQQALAQFDAFLPKLEEMVARGQLADARQLAGRERGAAAGDGREAFDAALEVIRALEERQQAIRAAVESLATQGKEATVGTRRGPRKGKIEDVSDEAIVLAVTIRAGGRVMGQTRFTIPWSDLTVEAVEKYAAEWAPKDASAHAAVALLAVTLKNADDAEEALAAAGQHAVSEYLKGRIVALRLGPVEAGARLAWEKIASKSSGTLNEAGAKALSAAIAEYEKEHGGSEFAKSMAAEIAAAKARCDDVSVPVSSEGLIGHWKFDEGRGKRPQDSSGKNHHGTLTGGSWVPGKHGRALKTFGKASIDVSGPSEFVMDAASFSIAAWIRTDNQWGIFFMKNADGPGWRDGGKMFFVSNGKFAFDAFITGKTQTRTVIADNEWHHCAATYDKAAQRVCMYVDGQLEGEVKWNLRPEPKNSVVRIMSGPSNGNSPGRQNFTGEIDDVRFYQRPLSAAEVKTLAGPRGKERAGSVAQYDFDSRLEGQLRDSSGRESHGKLTSARRVRGVRGMGLGFNGEDQFAQIPRTVAEDLSLSFWFKTNRAGPEGEIWFAGHGLVDCEINGAGDFGTAILEDKVVFGGSGPDVTIKSKSSVTDDRWHHVVATREMATREIKLYVDGKLENEGVGPEGLLDSAGRLTIGCIQKNIGYFKGAIDELQIFDFVLDEKQVRLLKAFKPVGPPAAATPSPGEE